MSTTPDFYHTIEAPLRAPEFKVRGSRFLTDIIPVETKEEIESTLVAIRKEFYDATHHCFAYRIGPTGAVLRAADDGEPTGTAGKPILLVLTSAKLTNTLVVVTRYYGGTKLGTGGLARAYAEAAQQAVSMSKIRTVYLTEELSLQLTYEDLGALERLAAQFEATLVDISYLDSVSVRYAVRKSLIAPFRAKIIDAFHGRLQMPPDTASSSQVL